MNTVLCAWLAMSLSSPATVCDSTTKLCAVALEAGDVAPFGGQLLSPPLAISLAQGKNACDVTMGALRHKCLDDQAVEQKRSEALRAADAAAYTGTIGRCEGALTSCRKLLDAGTPWYKSPWFLVPLTAIATGVTVSLVAHGK